MYQVSKIGALKMVPQGPQSGASGASLSHYIVKSRAHILTRVQSKAFTEPSSFSSLYNFPYSKGIHYFSQARQ